MGKKYELTEETKEFYGRTLYRIKALKDFGDVEVGDLGGYIESESNLMQEGCAWVYGNAMVYGSARVCDNAKVCDNAEVHANAKVYGDAKVCDNAKVYGDAMVLGSANVYGDAKVFDNANVYGDAKVFGNANVYGSANVYGYADVRGDAEIKGKTDYIVFKNWWSSGRYFTWTRSNNMWKVGYFYGTGKELVEKAYKDSELSGREYERVVKYVESILADEKKQRKQ